MPRNKRSTRQSSGGNNNTDGQTSQTTKNENGCSVCDEILNNTGAVLCKVCNCYFHHECVGINDETFTMLSKIMHVVGWVCAECVTLLSKKRVSITSEIDILRTTVKKQEDCMTSLAKKFDDLSTKFDETIRSVTAPRAANNSPTAVSPDHNETGRKHNVVISGLSEIQDTNDKDAALELFSSALHLQPLISSCKHLGKPSE